ncbi:hypothetical protein ACOSP7_010783 [Xanthoceras sorbifolium]|uniref:Uncharacterized protein n=1 Tax=Xanthoceras sorbifolium TaxID=99658 RepID=A0ABQ8HSM0_9ROSI|nr:hypothetical protein JRO89_XS07G0059100 [Xanthoceras sorbifolium]
MSMPLGQQPPPVTIAQQSYNHSVHGSVGPLIAVLVVIIILGILAGMVGRLCSGKTIMGYGQYDIESWAETKCSTCIDGRISPPLPRPHLSDTASLPTPVSPETHQETKPEDQQNSTPNPSTTHVQS